VGSSCWAAGRRWVRRFGLGATQVLAARSAEVEQQHWASASVRLRLGVSARDAGTGVCGHGAARRAGLNVQVELWRVQVRKLTAPAAVRRGVAARRGRRGSIAGVSSAGGGKLLREMQERDGRIKVSYAQVLHLGDAPLSL
jgi:hypothetical protein